MTGTEGGTEMTQKKDQNADAVLQEQNQGTEKKPGKQEISATWAEETIMDLDEFIESQGIYIRQ